MNIPEEVIREASGEVGDALWSAKPSPHETEVVRLSAPVIAAWARKEALREAVRNIHAWASVHAGPEGAFAALVIEKQLRALAGGDN